MRTTVQIICGVGVAGLSVASWGEAAHQDRSVKRSPATQMSVEGRITQLELSAAVPTMQVTTDENRVETLVVDPTTVVSHDGAQIASTELQRGERVSVQYVEQHGRQVATAVTVTSAPPLTQSDGTPATANSSQSSSPADSTTAY